MQTVDLNAQGLRSDERLERLKLFGLSSPAILLVLVVLVAAGWLAFLRVFHWRRRPVFAGKL